MATYIELPAYGDVHFGAPVANFAALPTTDQIYTIRLAEDVGVLYYYNGTTWLAVSADVAISGISNTNSITLAIASAILSATLNLSANAADAGNSLVSLDIESTASKGLRAQIANSVIRALLSASSPLSYNNSTGAFSIPSPLPVANGGTNSVTALNNNRIMQSSGGAVVEASAITASRALVSDTNGIPVAAAATTTTEIGYVNGVTSAIQTQINGKEPSISSGTTSQYWRGDKSFQTLNIAALTDYTDGSSASAGQINEVLTASQASLTTVNVGSTGVYGYAISLSVTAGRWLAWGSVQFNQNGANLTGGLQCGISSSSTGSGLNNFDTTLLNGLISSTSDAIAATPIQVISIGATTTYYLNTLFTYSSGTPKHAGKINFLRIG